MSAGGFNLGGSIRVGVTGLRVDFSVDFWSSWGKCHLRDLGW